jgi:hypothetical protein
MLSLGDKGAVLLGLAGDDPPDGFETVTEFTEFWVMLRNRLLELVKHASFQDPEAGARVVTWAVTHAVRLACTNASVN